MNSIMKFALVASAALAISACGADKAPATDSNTGADAGTEVAQDWTSVVTETPEGGFRMGNPDAKVHLIEYASFTCNHCRDFHAESVQHLQPEYVRTGKVSYELRPFMLNIYDFAVSQLAMCQGADKFFRWTDELFSNQDGWIEPFTKLTEADIKPLQNLSMGRQIQGLARAGQLNVFAAQRGIPGAEFDACVSNETAIDALAKRQQESIQTYRIEGTPTFVLNGKKVDNATSWEQLRPHLDKALS